MKKDAKMTKEFNKHFEELYYKNILLFDTAKTSEERERIKIKTSCAESRLETEYIKKHADTSAWKPRLNAIRRAAESGSAFGKWLSVQNGIII